MVAPRAGGIEFPYRDIDDDEEVDLGGLTLRAIGKPGHTPEHLGYGWLVEMRGLEPLTPAMRTRCSSS